MGGSELTVPAQATVRILAFPSSSPQETITTGTGFKRVERPTLILSCFDILLSVKEQSSSE